MRARSRRLLPAPRTSDDAGLVAVIVALVFALVLVPLLALVVDLGVSRVASARARDTADAAALAAALLRPDAATAEQAAAAARALVEDGLDVGPDQWASCVDQQPLPAGTPPSPGNCVSFDLAAHQVRVTVPPRPVPGVFAGLLGAAPPAVSASSVAAWGPQSQTCALCVLGAYAGGAQQLVVRGGDAAVGDTLALGAAGSLVLDPGRTVTVTGALSGAGIGGLLAVPGPPPADPLAAPLAALASLPAAATAATAQLSPSGACSPGTYVDVSGCTGFGAGVYVVTGRPAPAGRTTVTLRGGGTGVVLYLTCSTGDATGGVHPAACATVGRRPPRLAVDAAAGEVRLEGHAGYAGLAVAVDPGTAAVQTFSGAGRLTVAGSVDAPAAVLRNPAPGTPAQLVVTGGRLVVGRVAYDTLPAVPPHPYVVVEAPAAPPAASGPVRLLAPPAS